MLNTVTNIDARSPLRGRVRVGDKLLSINGHEVEDVLDYRYWSYEPQRTLVFRSADGGGVQREGPQGRGRGPGARL